MTDDNTMPADGTNCEGKQEGQNCEGKTEGGSCTGTTPSTPPATPEGDTGAMGA